MVACFSLAGQTEEGLDCLAAAVEAQVSVQRIVARQEQVLLAVDRLVVLAVVRL